MHKKQRKVLEDYIGKWYNLNKNAPWYNSHLKKNCYRGYWAWEVAAIAKIMQIDDSDLRIIRIIPMIWCIGRIQERLQRGNLYKRVLKSF